MRRSSRDTEESARRITRRGLLLGGAQLGFMGLLGLRMRYMQVEQADEKVLPCCQVQPEAKPEVEP